MATYSFIYVNRVTPFSDDILNLVWDKMEKDGILRHLFYDGSNKTREEFFEFMGRRNTLPFTLFKEAELIGFFWLNSFVGRTAQIHFTAFRNSMGTRRNATHFGTKCIQYCLSLKDDNGFFIDTVVGVTPVSNTLARRFNEKAGMIKIGLIPNYCIMHYEGRIEDGVLTYATRESYGFDGKAETIWQE